MNGKEERKHPRHTVPVVIDMPDISDLPLVPEDVSVGGFQVIVPKKPEVGVVFHCDIQIFEERFENCHGRVVWTGKNPDTPGSWVIGVRVDHAEEDIDRFTEKMKEVVEQIRTA